MLYYWCYRAWLQDWDPLCLDQCLHMTLRWGGWMETHIMSVDFYIPHTHADFSVLAWPSLERRPLRDYVC